MAVKIGIDMQSKHSHTEPKTAPKNIQRSGWNSADLNAILKFYSHIIHQLLLLTGIHIR